MVATNIIIIILVLLALFILFFWLMSGSGNTSNNNKPIDYIANLIPLQTNIPTSATGQGKLTLSGDKKSIKYDVIVKNLSGNPINGMFTAGSSGQRLKTLIFKPDRSVDGATVWRSSGVWSDIDVNDPLTNGVVMDLLNNNIYVVVTTANNPRGEISGNFIPVLFS